MELQDKLLARMAQMEAELSTLRTQRGAAPKAFDESEYTRQLAQRMTQDPLGTMAQMGIPIEHVTRVAVVHALGDKATPEQRALAAMGPQISATQSLASSLESLSRRLEGIEKQGATASVATSMQKLIADKAKYPSLSKAYAADPSLFESDVAGHKGTAEELAAVLEGRLTKFASALGAAPQAASEDADSSADAQSTQGKPASETSISGVPPLPVNKQGVFTGDDHAKLKAEILRKYPEPTA